MCAACPRIARARSSTSAQPRRAMPCTLRSTVNLPSLSYHLAATRLDLGDSSIEGTAVSSPTDCRRLQQQAARLSAERSALELATRSASHTQVPIAKQTMALTARQRRLARSGRRHPRLRGGKRSLHLRGGTGRTALSTETLRRVPALLTNRLPATVRRPTLGDSVVNSHLGSSGRRGPAPSAG
jgi:hypothetical protein